MSDQFKNDPSIWKNSVDYSNPPQDNLGEHYSTQIDERFIFKLSKESKNINKEVKDCCKILHFSSDWSYEEVLMTTDGLNPQEYPQLFIFVIEVTNFGFCAENQANVQINLTKLQENLIKFGRARPVVLQLSSHNENLTTLYYKDKCLNKFTMLKQQQISFNDMDRHLTIFNSFLDGKFNDIENEDLNFLSESQNLSLILRLLRTLVISEGFFGSIILYAASKGTKADFLAALDSPFESNGRMLSIRSQKYISDVFGDDNDPDNDTSVLLTAIENENTDVIDYLITYWTHLIQQLPFEHQVKISTAAFETNQLDVFCDLLNIVDYPFPDNFKPELIEHARLRKITAQRIEFKAAIEADDFEKIYGFIRVNRNLEYIYNSSNNSALTEAINSRKFGVFYYLKSLGLKGEYCDEILNKLSREDKEKAVKLATEQRKLNVNVSQTVIHQPVMLLSSKSRLHNSRVDKKQEKNYLEKIIKWFQDIYTIAPLIIEVAASCEELKIIFDFESDSVENASLEGQNAAGSTYPKSKWIFVGAKLSDKKCEQKIKGVIAHELCHYVMKMVYENQENPYYKYMTRDRDIFEGVVRAIDKWSQTKTTDLDDQCNGIISSVFIDYKRKDFHPELIVRAVQILVEFDDDEEKSRYLQQKYKILFGFWETIVVPELQSFSIKTQFDVIFLNKLFKVMPERKKENWEFSVFKNLNPLFDNKVVMITSNTPRLLLVNIFNFFYEKFGNLMDTKNVFVDALKLENQELKTILTDMLATNPKLNIIIDCSKGFNDNLKDVAVGSEVSVIFIASNESQAMELERQLENFEISTKLKIDYNWNDLKVETQKLLLQTKVNFQNNLQYSLIDLIDKDSHIKEQNINTSANNTNEDEIRSFSKLIDVQLLNLLVEKSLISINTKEEMDLFERYFTILFKSRQFVKKQRDNNDDVDLDENQTNSIHMTDKIIKLSQGELLMDVEDVKYVIISDMAGNGKSWTMKKFTKIIRDQNPTRWVTYVDLKQFIDEFKAHEGEPEFSRFMIEKILNLQHNFEAKIFQKHYKDGKVFILFDGFDEIAPNCAEFVSKLAQNFQSNDGNQLWIATRDYFEIDLQTKLKLYVAYSLAEMTEAEGVKLIANTWVLMDSKEGKNEPKSKKDFDECIKLSQKYKRYQQKARLIVKKVAMSWNRSIGMPQLFKMIADGFKNEENVDELQGSEIYDKFIKILYKRWSEEKGPLRNEASIESQGYENPFWKFHQFCALEGLFPEFVALFFPGYDKSEWPKEEVIACGIMSVKNGKYIFLHETFREIFVADLIAKSLKKQQINEIIVELLVIVLTVEKYKVVRIFLNDIIDECLDLKNYQNQMQGFYNMENFHLCFIESPRLVITLLNCEGIGKLNEFLHQNITKMISNTEDTRQFSEFQELLFKVLKAEHLKDLIIKQEVFQKIIRSSLKIDVFKDILSKTEAITDRDFIKIGLKLMSYEPLMGNIFYFLCQSSNLNAEKINTFLEVMHKYLSRDEIFELMSNCNRDNNNVFLICAKTRNGSNLKLLWRELSKYFSVEHSLQSFKEFIKQKNRKFENILYFSARYDSIDFCRDLWNLLFETFIDRNELKDFILQNDTKANNFVHNLVLYSKNSALIEWTFKTLKENFSDIQYQGILESKGEWNRNLLQSAAFGSKLVKIHKCLWNIFEILADAHEYIVQFFNEVDGYGENILHIAAKNSSREVFNFMIEGLEKIVLRDEMRVMLTKSNNCNQNLLQSAASMNESLELHETLWKTLQKYFDHSEILQFIRYVDNDKDNVFFVAVSCNSKEIVEFTWRKIKNVLNRVEQKKYLLLTGRQNKTLAERSLDNYQHKKEVYDLIKYIEQENQKSQESDCIIQ